MTRPLALLVAGVLLLFCLDGFVLGAPLLWLVAFTLLALPVLVGFLQHGEHGPFREAAAAIHCGAFAGMTSERVLRYPNWVLLAGGRAGLLLTLLHHSWRGIGGRLGSTRRPLSGRPAGSHGIGVSGARASWDELQR